MPHLSKISKLSNRMGAVSSKKKRVDSEEPLLHKPQADIENPASNEEDSEESKVTFGRLLQLSKFGILFRSLLLMNSAL